MARALFNNVVIAESDDIEVVEGNAYFPRSSVKAEFLRDSSRQTVCPWKGTASYLSVSVDGEEAADVAWFYPEPKPAAEAIAGRVAFYPAVTVES